MRPLQGLARSFVALAFLSGAVAVAQVSATKPLIQEKVDDNNLIALKGNTPPAAIAANDQGRVNPGMAMSGMILALRRSPDRQAAFDAFVASQYDPTSPNFHHWLEPEQVGEKFGPAQADIAIVSNWLSSHGLAVESVSKDRMTMSFSGTAAQVEETFHTEIHKLMVKGEAHIANMSDPQIPIALEAVVLGPKALHNFIPRPLHRLGGKVVLNKQTGKWQRVEGADTSAAGIKINSPRPQPDIQFSCGTGCEIEDMTPYDFATIYNVLPLWTAATPIDGTGQTIAIVGTSDVRASDVNAFRSAFGLPAGTLNLIKTTATDPGFCKGTTGNCVLDDQIENALDVEWAGAVAKGATIDLVVTASTGTNDTVFASAQYIVNNKTAPVLNVSYGLCELELGTSGNSTWNTLWQSAASEGIAAFVSSGDAGAATCDQNVAAQGPYGAQFGLSVSGIASSQYDTAVGGTDLNWNASPSTYWNTSDGTTGVTAKGYIQETPWNDTCTSPAEVAIVNQALSTSYTAAQICYFIASHQITAQNAAQEQGVLNFVNTIGAGGGASNCTTNSTTNTTVTPDPTSCSGGNAKPTWQAGVTGIPSDSKRDIPDVSFFAGNGFFSSAYVICVSDWGTCVTSPFPTTEPTVGEIGGTSGASPAMAGVMALINQKAGSAQGSPNSELYTLAGKQTYASCSTETVQNSSSCYFNDIDTGTIAMPCAASTPGCTIAATGYTIGVQNGYAAGAGFDNATGLGSLNVANVVNGWTTAVTGTAMVAVTANPTSFASGQGTTVTVTVTGSSGTPTGSVTLTSGSFTSASHTLTAGATTFNLSPGVLAAGTDTITAQYSGDSVYAAANGTTQVTVTQSTFTLAATAPPAISRGASATSTITWTTTNFYSSNVNLSSCTLNTGGPTNSATDTPTCSLSSTAFGQSGSGTATVATKAATTAALSRPAFPGKGMALAGSGAILALTVFFGIPARRRGWRAMLGMLVLMLTFGALSACGGGGGSGGGGGGGSSDPGTASGQYTFTVKATGTDAASTTATTTFTVTVN